MTEKGDYMTEKRIYKDFEEVHKDCLVATNALIETYKDCTPEFIIEDLVWQSLNYSDSFMRPYEHLMNRWVHSKRISKETI